MQSWLHRLLRSPALQTTAVITALILLLLTAIHPYTFGAMPDTHDGLLHLYRLVALDFSIQQGDFWPRFSPGLIYGYGSPIFNYYAPLSLYPLEIIHLLGFSFLNAFLIGLAVYAFIGITGAYLLGRIWVPRQKTDSASLGHIGGLVTAIAYAYAPYTLYNALHRAALAECLALAIIPWILWAFWRLAHLGRRRDFLIAVVLLAFFIPIHNITSLHATVLLGAYGLYLWWVSPDPRRAFLRLLLAGVVAAGLTVFFWLPALAEAGYVQLGRATGPASADFHNNFQALSDTLSLPLTADLNQMHPPVPRSIGWPQLTLALIGVGIMLWQIGQGAGSLPHWFGWLGLSIVGFIGLILLSTRASTWIWETLPLIHYTQLPWRLLGLASLLLAILAGAGAVMVAQRIPWLAGRLAWSALCLTGMIVYAMPWLYVQYLPQPHARNITDVQNFERSTGWLATASLGEYLPAWTREPPDPDRLIGLYARSDEIPRLQSNNDISGVTARWQIDAVTLEFIAAQDTTLVFDWLFFPGWWAKLDGESVRIYPIQLPGFIAVDVPEGMHILQVGMGPTQLRLIAMIVSGIFLLPLIGLPFVGRLWRTRWRVNYHEPIYASIGIDASLLFEPWDNSEGGLCVICTADYYSSQSENDTEAPSHTQGDQQGIYIVLAAAVIGMGLFAFKTIAIDNLESPIKRGRFAHGIEAGLQTPIRVDFDHEITLLGYDLSTSSVPSGGKTQLNLYWQLVDRTIEETYSSVVYLRDSEGSILLVTGSQHPGDYPTDRWLPGFYIQERLPINLSPALPPGEYSLDVALYSHTLERNLDTFDAAGSPLGVIARIGTLTVTRPRWHARANQIHVERSANKHLGDGITLLGISGIPESAAVGQPLPLTLLWQAVSDPDANYYFQVIWRDGAQVAGSTQIRPLTTGYATIEWQRRDVWKGVHLLTVPGRLQAGSYEVAVHLLDANGALVGEPVEIGPMQVDTPSRTFDRPDAEIDADIGWDNGITLAGYDLPTTSISHGDALEMAFYWQTQADLFTSLTFFVHLVDDRGNIVAQQDRLPQSGTRLTTGWAPGEFVFDSYLFFIGEDIPRGDYRLRIGWYDARTSSRVRLLGGIDFWLLPQSIQIR